VVNRRILSKWDSQAPPSEDDWAHDQRKIDHAQLYATQDVLEALGSKDGRIILWTDKSVRDVADMGWDLEDVRDLLKQAIQSGSRKNPEWCEAKPGGHIAACDAYSLARLETNPNSGMGMLMEYYIKFALGHTGTVILIISCHTKNV
jgi:hypothetical protein